MRNTGIVPTTIDEYLAEVPEPARTTLQQIRLIIRSTVPPEATEIITYRIPAFHYKGALVGFAAFAKHCSLFPMSDSIVAKFAAELADYTTSKGTIQFPLDQPPPAALVRKIVKARLAENADRRFRPVAKKAAANAPFKPKPQPPAHPLQREIAAVRRAIVTADPAIKEAVKWNAPSFHTTEFFATINLRAKDRVEVILHTGAKKKEAKKFTLPDPAGLTKWLAPDRCLVSLGSGKALNANLKPLQAIVRHWLTLTAAPRPSDP